MPAISTPDRAPGCPFTNDEYGRLRAGIRAVVQSRDTSGLLFPLIYANGGNVSVRLVVRGVRPQTPDWDDPAVLGVVHIPCSWDQPIPSVLAAMMPALLVAIEQAVTRVTDTLEGSDVDSALELALQASAEPVTPYRA